MRSHLAVAALLAVPLLAAAWPVSASSMCDRCVDRWTGEVKADGRVRHQMLADAATSYRVSLSPSDANADLVVAFDGEWPPDQIACRSAIGGPATDTCEFESRGAAPVFLFVLGGERATHYELEVEPSR